MATPQIMAAMMSFLVLMHSSWPSAAARAHRGVGRRGIPTAARPTAIVSAPWHLRPGAVRDPAHRAGPGTEPLS